MKNSNQRKPMCSNEDPVWPKRKLGIISLQVLAFLFLVLYNKSLKCCLYSMSLTVISQLSLEPTPHHAVAQYDYMGTALLKICMTFTMEEMDENLRTTKIEPGCGSTTNRMKRKYWYLNR